MKGSYYQIQQRVFKELEDNFKIQPIQEEELLYYELTKHYAISEKCIRKRIETMVDLGILKREMGVLIWNQKEKDLRNK